MLKMLKAAAAAATLSLAAVSAQAATIEGDLTFAGLVLVPDSDFSATGGVDLVQNISAVFDASGDLAGALVSPFDVDFSAPGTLFSLDNGISFVASLFTEILDGSFTAAGTLTGGIFDDTAATFTLTTVDSLLDGFLDIYVAEVSITDAAVAPVPLPAAGFLLVGALGGLAAAGRRKAKKA